MRLLKIAHIELPNEIDFSVILRAFAASSVVVWHAHGWNQAWPDVFNVPGRVGVWVFFAISGYVISYGFLHGRYRFEFPDVLNFYRNRALRILPLFYVITAVSIVTLLLRGESIPIEWTQIPAQFFALQWTQEFVLNGVFWTLGIELQFYALAPLMAWALRHPERRSLIYGIILWVMAWVWPFVAWNCFGTSLDNRTTLGNLQHFLTGMLVCRAALDSDVRKLLAKPQSALILTASGLALICVTNLLYHNAPGVFWRLCGALGADLAVSSLLLAHCAISQTSSSQPGRVTQALMAIGVLSYGLYAWHGYLLNYFPVMQKQLIALFLASLTLAYFSYILVERPALELRRLKR